jgi:hypothetical protein
VLTEPPIVVMPYICAIVGYTQDGELLAVNV